MKINASRRICFLRKQAISTSKQLDTFFQEDIWLINATILILLLYRAIFVACIAVLFVWLQCHLGYFLHTMLFVSIQCYICAMSVFCVCTVPLCQYSPIYGRIVLIVRIQCYLYAYSVTCLLYFKPFALNISNKMPFMLRIGNCLACMYVFFILI